MDNETLRKLFEEQVNLCQTVLIAKGVEYSEDSDRLHNFRVAATLQGIPMRRALAGMMAKHTASIYDLCFQPLEVVATTTWDEKITDHLNYLFLLRAILAEEYSMLDSTSRKDF